MQKISPTDELKSAIQVLEVVQAVNKQQLKEDFRSALIKLKPINIIAGTIKNIVSTSFSPNNIIDNAIGVATGYLSKKIFIGTSGNIFRKFFGTVLQFGVTKVVAHNPETIKSLGWFLIEYMRHKKERNL